MPGRVAWRTIVLVVLIASLAGCGDGAGTGGEIAGLVGLRVEPADATHVVDGVAAVTAPYAAIGVFEDGSERDVTGRVVFELADASLGAFEGEVFTSTVGRGGATRVTARAGSVQGSTGLTLLLRQRVNDPKSTDLPSDPAGLFDGTLDPARAPDVVYPNDGVLVPPNLGRLEIHYLAGASNTLFELAFQNARTDVRVYLRCTALGAGCLYEPDPMVWRWLAETNRGGPPLAISVRGTDDAGSAVGASGTLDLLFSQDDLSGALYYWTTSGGTGIIRYDFAGTATAGEKYLGTELTEGTCVGCHALSRDGKKMVMESGGQNDGRLLILDVATKTPIVPYGSTDKSIFESWNADGSAFVGVYGDTGATDFNLKLFDGTTGATLGTIDVGATDGDGRANHPDWSPDGARIAFSRAHGAATNQRMYQGSIEVVTDVGGGAFGGPEVIVPHEAGRNRYYPAFAPDGSFLVYNESVCPSGTEHRDCNADSDPSARVFAVPMQPGATPVELARANAPGKTDAGDDTLGSSFPRWSPFVFQRTSEEGSRLMWVTLSSTRRYGLRPPPPSVFPNGESPEGTLIWMAAVDPDAVASGVDPSFPAFALPFQDLTTSNHIAQWTTEIAIVERAGTDGR